MAAKRTKEFTMAVPKKMFLRSVIELYSKPSWMHRSYTSDNTKFNIYGEVINIPAKKKPIEPALEPLVPFLSKKIITSVIKDQANRRLGFRFFIWASRRERLRSLDSFSVVIDMLSQENGCDLYWQTLEELKSGGVSVNSYCLCVLISAYAKMDMAENAVESFGRIKEIRVLQMKRREKREKVGFWSGILERVV